MHSSFSRDPTRPHHTNNSPSTSTYRKWLDPIALAIVLYSAQSMAAINPNRAPASNSGGEAPRSSEPTRLYSGDFPGLEDISQLRAAEKQARAVSPLSEWSVKFEKPQAPENPLSLFFNSAPLLKKELRKTLPEVVGLGINEMTEKNFQIILQKLFETVGDDRWMSRTRGSVTTPLSADEFARYKSDIHQTQIAVTNRLIKNKPLQAFVIERFNALYPQLLVNGNVGRKTLQSLLLGCIALWDIVENARIQMMFPSQDTKASMNTLDWAGQVARVAVLLRKDNRKMPILRLQIIPPKAPDSNKPASALIYTIPPYGEVLYLLGNGTQKSHGITGQKAAESLFANALKVVIEMK